MPGTGVVFGASIATGIALVHPRLWRQTDSLLGWPGLATFLPQDGAQPPIADCADHY